MKDPGLCTAEAERWTKGGGGRTADAEDARGEGTPSAEPAFWMLCDASTGANADTMEGCECIGEPPPTQSIRESAAVRTGWTPPNPPRSRRLPRAM